MRFGLLPLASAALVCACTTSTSSSTPAPPTGSAQVIATSHAPLHVELQHYVDGLLPELDAITAERREALDALARYVIDAQASGRPVRLIFICTHNSRRSHMGQLWAATAAAWFDVVGVETYSGGTEATAFNPRAVAAMQRAGFAIATPSDPSDNPRYTVTYGPEAPEMIVYSKTWDAPDNPGEKFAAIMTCTQAEAACPFVRGASFRIAVPYEDPKQADDTPDEAATYDARTRQIATEMFYVFRAVAQARG